jgi:hypothetical protein
MANPRIKSGSLFYKGKRVGVMQNVTYSIKSNDTQEMSDAGAYNTDGIVTVEISCDTIVPITGTGISVVADAIAHNDVAITLGIFDGKIHEIEDCRNTECSFSGEVASGKMTGKFTWHGSAPRVTG